MKTRGHFEIPIAILSKRLDTMQATDKRRVNKEVYETSVKQIRAAIALLQKQEEK